MALSWCEVTAYHMNGPMLLLATTRLASIAIAFLTATAAAQERFSFPDDPSVLDVKKALGAKGDGKTDDTDILQRALDIGSGRDKEGVKQFGNRSRVVFLPNGTYRLTRSLVVKSAVGPWLYGESRAGVIFQANHFGPRRPACGWLPALIHRGVRGFSLAWPCADFCASRARAGGGSPSKVS